MNFELSLKIQRAVALLQANKPNDGKPYLGAFSGGKDSVVINALAAMAEVPVEWHSHLTTIDPPEVVRFIRDAHPDVIWDKPRFGNFFHRMVQKGEAPSRKCRWCCDDYKEGHRHEGINIVGIRIAESRNRTARWPKCVMEHERSGQTFVLPIRLGLMPMFGISSSSTKSRTVRCTTRDSSVLGA